MTFEPNHRIKVVLVIFFLAWCTAASAFAQDFEDDMIADDLVEKNHYIADPLESLNRVFFTFNDKLYFWVLKPVSTTYSKALPDDVRMCVGNAFNNIIAPIRIVNNILQGKVSDAGVELARFVINTVAGAGGLGDPAKDSFNLHAKSEDFGQTLGKWGVGEGLYICWPILGPSNIRDTLGFVGDTYLNPLTYLTMSEESTGYKVMAGNKINSTSLQLGDYEQFIESALDPYSSMRNMYTQSRRSKIADNQSQSQK